MPSSFHGAGMALVILASLFDSSQVGIMSLPVVFYHTIQMGVALLLIPRLSAYIKANIQVTSGDGETGVGRKVAEEISE